MIKGGDEKKEEQEQEASTLVDARSIGFTKRTTPRRLVSRQYTHGIRTGKERSASGNRPLLPKITDTHLTNRKREDWLYLQVGW